MEKAVHKTDREEKWRATYTRFSGWDTEKQRAVQEEEARVVASWLLELGLPSYDILEVGCGNGHFGKVIIEKLQKASVPFTYHFTDFLPECIEQAQKTMQAVSDTENVSFSTLDVYEIDTVFQPESQQIILSTGFVSPVTYKDALPKVASVLKQNGILICDFINHLSPIVFFSRPLGSIEKFLKILYKALQNNDPKERYHFGLFGIRAFYKDAGLQLLKHRTIRLRRNPLICLFKKQ